MLDLDLDLEADLGVDTVKQAEMFAAVRAAYNIPRDENLKLRDFPTLAHVIKFAHDRSALVTAADSLPSKTIREQRSSSLIADAGSRHLRSCESYSAPRAQSRRCGRRSRFASQRRESSIRQPRRHHADEWRGGSIDATPARAWRRGTLHRRLSRCRPPSHALLKAGSPPGRSPESIWLPALDPKATSARSWTLAGWHEALRMRVKSLYVAMRALYEQIAPARHVPGLGNAAGRTARLRRRRRGFARSAAPSPASPRPTSASGRMHSSKPSISSPIASLGNR